MNFLIYKNFSNKFFSFFRLDNFRQSKNVFYLTARKFVFTKFFNKSRFTASTSTYHKDVSIELSIVSILFFHSAHKIKSKLFCCNSSLYKNFVFLSNLAQSTWTIFGICSKILFKKFILRVFLSALFSNSKSFSFSVQKYFSILRPLSFLYSSISRNAKCPKGRETIAFRK